MTIIGTGLYAICKKRWRRGYFIIDMTCGEVICHCKVLANAELILNALEPKS